MGIKTNVEEITEFENKHFVTPDERTYSDINHQFFKTLDKTLRSLHRATRFLIS